MFSFLIVTAFSAVLLPDLRLSDSRTLRVSGLNPLLGAYHFAALDTGKVGHIFPGPVAGQEARGIELVQKGDTSLILSPVAGFEWRNPSGEGGYAFDVGGHLQGRADRVAFWVDARMVSAKSSSTGASWDGQYQEFQKDGTNSNFSYTSYSRYEGKLAFESPVGRIGLGRSREQWGPSIAYPLVLRGDAQPMPLIDWTLTWGDLRVRTLWASLSIDGVGVIRRDTNSRSFYGHRYEWLATSWLTLGATEALIIYNHEEMIGMLPFAPLYIEKGQGLEDGNNGELAFDVELRPLLGLRLYGEFLIDDMSEPTSLFNTLWKNRWAYNLGTHYASRWRGCDLGAILEFSHVEPWVYAHYSANTAQASSHGVLLGNPSGPNSRSIKLQGYSTKGNIHLESSLEWVWKGTDLGSRWTDTLADNETTQKTFLADGGKMGCRGEVHLGLSYGYLTVWLDFAKQFTAVDLQTVRPNAPVALRLQAGW